MDFAADQFTERGIDQLVPGDTALAGKSLRHDSGGKVGIVRGLDQDLRARQAGADQFGDFLRIHADHGSKCPPGP